jgi:hypothetical protein
VLLGDDPFGGGLFPYHYVEAGGWVLSPKQLPQERRSYKDDLYDYRKETIELLFQRIIPVVSLKILNRFSFSSFLLFEVIAILNLAPTAPRIFWCMSHLFNDLRRKALS